MTPDRDLIAALNRAERWREACEDGYLDSLDRSAEEEAKAYQDVLDADREAAELANLIGQEPAEPEPLDDDVPF